MAEKSQNLRYEMIPAPYEPAFYASRPTRMTLFFRTFFLWQMLRFIWMNWKMIRMIRKSHH